VPVLYILISGNLRYFPLQILFLYYHYRKKQEMEQLENALKTEKERLEAAAVQATFDYQQRTEERRRKIIAKMEIIQQREVIESLKVSSLYGTFHVLRLNEYQKISS